MKNEKPTILVTGAAGFIGYHLCFDLLKKNFKVIGLDNLNEYYDVNLKKDRLKILKRKNDFTFHKISLENFKKLRFYIRKYSPKYIIHLAAQAGVRYSLENPRSYIESNIIGTFNILEIAKDTKPDHLLIASTSSVYGANKKQPYKEIDKADEPLSLYAATKKSTELLAHSYSYNFNLNITAFRFFTVYGPWGRPDMAFYKFLELNSKNKPIEIFNYGKMFRDFTYIDDLVKSISKLIKVEPINRVNSDSLSSVAPFRVVNIGSSKKEKLMKSIKILENLNEREFKKKFTEMQKGDVPSTFASSTLLKKLTGFSPETKLEEGLKKFFVWYSQYKK